MDLIDDIKKRDQEARDARLESTSEVRLVAAHNGEVLEVEGFQCVRVSSLYDLFRVPPAVICLISDADAKVAATIAADLDVNGCEFAQLTNLPGQQTAFESSKWLAVFKTVDFVAVMTDIADQRMVEEAMSKEELEHSMAKKQHAQRARKDGEIRPLMDFDRTSNPDDDLDTTVEL